MSDRSIQIAPSILAADFANFGAEIHAIEAQGCDRVHVDVMDVHLMIAPTDPYLRAFADAGSDILTIHAGADVLVAGSAVFRGGSVANPAPCGENIRAIRDASEAAR